MTKLTISIRESIRRAVLKHRFGAEVDTLTDRYAALASDVYDDLYSKEDRERIASLPKDWLPTVDQASVQFGGLSNGYTQLSFNGSGFRFEYHSIGSRLNAEQTRECKKPVANKHRYGCWKVYAADHRLTRRYEKLQAERDALHEAIGEAKQQISAALGSLSSVEALIKAWPEIEPFAKTFAVPAPARLPAIPAAALNKTLKLPAPEAAA